MKQNPTIDDSEIAAAARGGAISFAGAATSALMGFILTIVLARALGDTGAGIVLQSIAAFTIAQSVARLGMDTAAVWLLPRLANSAPEKVRGAAVAMLIPPAVAGLIAAGGLALVAPAMQESLGETVTDAIVAVGWFLPFGTVLMVALAATRGLGGVVPYTLIGSIALPTIRPVAVLATAGVSAGALAGAIAWAAPVPIALLCAVVVVWLRVRRVERPSGTTGKFIADASLQRRIWGFAAPRTISSALEQSIVWLDVMLVGAIAGASEAGVYGTASRFVTAGLIVATAVRIVVAPRFSAMLDRGDIAGVQRLYTTTTTWIVYFGTPIYIGFAIFAPTVLSWFGPEFERGATSLVILCIGCTVMLGAGNIQALLLMSGRSGLAAANKAAVLATNVVGNILLVPEMGMRGAAVTWAVSMILDAGLAAVQVRRIIGVRLQPTATAYAFCAAATCAVVPSVIALTLLGQSTLAAVTAGAVSAVLLMIWCAIDRTRLGTDGLTSIVRKRNRMKGPT
ncbi:MAG: oligosaccharide flippase family protein [Actinomycetia bacterium]|nr:oligosaccharide flippase family protein [Actinomycetes bacterium]